MSQQKLPPLLQFLTLRVSAIFVMLMVGFTSSAVFASTWEISSLMELLAKNRGGLTTFTEKKQIAMLDAPLESSGELLYKAPNYLEKRTLTPKPESFVLDNDTITIKRGKKRYTLKLQSHPKVAIFIESIRGTLAGDQAALQRLYQLDLAGESQQWTLTLSPSDSRMSDIINHILIHGEHGKINSIEIHQADGDYSVMYIEQPATP